MHYPRSVKLRQILEQEEYKKLAQVWDWHGEVPKEEREERELCKVYLEKDRLTWVKETDPLYETQLRKMHPLWCTPKNDILTGSIKTSLL